MNPSNKTSSDRAEELDLTGRIPSVYFEFFSAAEFIFRWENLVSQDDGCTRNAHHVAIQLRSYMDSGGVCSVGIQRLAREIKLDVRPTTSAIQELEDAGWVDVIRETNHSNRYFAAIPECMSRAVQLLARERKGKTRHGRLVCATAPILVDQVMGSLGIDLMQINPNELRKVEGRVRQILSRTYDVEWEATQVVSWLLMELPADIREPVGFFLARLASYGRTFKGRLNRDPRTTRIIDPAIASMVSDTISRLAKQMSTLHDHNWLS